MSVLTQFQSTHPRGVRRHAFSSTNIHVSVSIHAPAWGATHCADDCYSHMTTFQSTHPRGVRRTSMLASACQVVVSIHAPAWGATAARDQKAVAGNGFNPRTRVGCDDDAIQYVAGYVTFQSTHPRGVRRVTLAGNHGKVKFQSTHPRGVRPAPRSFRFAAF